MMVGLPNTCLHVTVETAKCNDAEIDDSTSRSNRWSKIVVYI